MADVVDDDGWRAVAPEGLALGLLSTTISFAILTSVVMGLRLYIRAKTKRLGVDDWFMLAGYTVNLGQSASVIYGSFTGLGTRDENLTRATSVEGYKNQKKYLYILRCLVGLSFLMSAAGLVVITNQCHPLDRYWDKSIPGTCWPAIIATALSYAASGSNVITDFTVAAIPFFLLRNVQMRPRLKLYVKIILGLGFLAGIASIIRVPFTNAYMKAHDVLYHAGNIVLWTIVECGLGIIAGSLPPLRAFFKRLVSDESTEENYKRSEDTGLVTFGQARVRKRPAHETELGITITEGEDNDSNNSNRDEDTESTRRILEVTKDVEQTSLQYGTPTLGRT
ncbi:hypothetical protein LX32DRAFT_708070 [Colletotrichum zoysiae]|uniref:Rhodopsin domain-containing protein n=1 Tax=Colletotrichum zoysiae TaxID=1216348 RepID=A0AAD9H7N4_9PEZI|nr:hypothetical protein LX32DRAFT_708070 [Colletotrichum zoysiae]